MDDFNKSYETLKQKYLALVQTAILEQDSEKQQELVKQILDTNSTLASEVRTYISSKTQTQPDPQELSILTNELLKIQDEFLKIQKAKDHKKTLEMILHQDNTELFNMKWKLNIFLFLLGGCIIYILFMIFRLSMPTLPLIQMPQSTLSPM